MIQPLSPGAARVAAKFRRSADGDYDYHPLICHMMDVAAVAQAMWEDRLGPRQKALLAEGLRLPEEEAGRWVAFLAGLHDVGKACPAFQRKDSGLSVRLADLLPVHQPIAPRVPGHGSVSGHAVTGLLGSRYHFPRPEAAKLGLILAGHHGKFPDDVGIAHGIAIGEPPNAVAAWDAVRAELFDALAAVLGVRPDSVPGGLVPNAAAMLLAGMISVTDWIGSHEGFFSWQPEAGAETEQYLEAARQSARKALKVIGWQAWQEPGKPREFSALFGFEPRPLQREAAEIARKADTPGLVIIEAPTGEGKTEAALLLADRWNAAGFRGAYVALPTQATANQLHGRVAKFLRERFADELHAGEDVNLLLVHGGTALLDHLDYLPVDISDDDGDAREGSVAAGEWFLPRKRSLLAPYGVGTVDQSLMAVLQVKHVFVRLFGLAGKVVVVDEVHAYDTYMTGLLERLLEWLGALGSPVVLLSATLPTTKRGALLGAYCRGVEGTADLVVEVPREQYPRITWLEGRQVCSRSFQASSSRSLGSARLQDTPDALCELLQREITGGGCAAVICNTVARAQETYRQLLKHADHPEGILPPEELGLFHARFLAKDRIELENDFLGKFGPPEKDGKSAGRPGRYVLVATQVIEQSLDLDFDVMVSDLAPVDLLLQRAGRLQRHDRGHRRHPLTLYVRWPGEEGGVPAFERGSTFVYDKHILLRTWHHLRERDTILIPEDVQDLVDLVYADDEECPADAFAALASYWRLTWKQMVKKQADERREAEDRRLRTPGAGGLLTDFIRFPREEDAPDLHPALQAVTRLAEPSVDVVLLPLGSPLVPLGSGAPHRERVRDLLRHTVKVSSRLAVPVLRRTTSPEAFAASPPLRRHRLLMLDEKGRANVDGLVFSYNSKLGLTIAAQEEEES